MSNNTGFENLKKDFPFFIIANRFNVSKILDLIGEDDIVVPPLSEVKVDSSKLMQLPDSSIFKLKSPSVSDLSKYGLLKTSEDAKKPVDPPTSGNSTGNNGSNSGNSSSGSDVSGGGSSDKKNK